MQEHEVDCEHRWRYFVNTASRAVRLRKCERCGVRDLLAARAPVVLNDKAAEKLPA